MSFSVRLACAADLPALRDLAQRVFEKDFGYPPGHQLQLHHPDPLDDHDFATHFEPRTRHALFVAVDDATAEPIGMAAVKRVRPVLCPDAPRALVARLDNNATAEIVRVYIARAHRRRGIARRLVDAVREFAASQPGYVRLYCHTDAAYPEAPRFWSSIGTLLQDNRIDEGEFAGTTTLFFTIPLRGHSSA